MNELTEEEENKIIDEAIRHLWVCDTKGDFTFDEATLRGCFRGCIRSTIKKIKGTEIKKYCYTKCKNNYLYKCNRLKGVCNRRKVSPE